MQITEVKSSGLEREYSVIAPSSHIKDLEQQKLAEVSKKVEIPGFRAGKAPIAIVKKRYGSALMAEILEKIIDEGWQKIISEKNLKPASRPTVNIKKFDENSDAECLYSFEVLPTIKLDSFGEINLERKVSPVTEDEITQALERLAKQNSTIVAYPKERAAAKGDLVTFDYTGSIDGETYPELSGNDYKVEVEAGMFMGDFDKHLAGLKAGDSHTFAYVLPKNFYADKLADQKANFTVKVKEVAQRVPAPIDDELAKKVGLTTIDELRSHIKDQITKEHNALTRGVLKRELFDKLAERFTFPIPKTMVEAEYKGILQSLNKETQGKSEEVLKAEYMPIAERRVRLGLLITEVGRMNDIRVSEEELKHDFYEAVRGNPFADYIIEMHRKKPELLMMRRNQLLEDKIVDFILANKAKVTDKEVSRVELEKLSAAE